MAGTDPAAAAALDISKWPTAQKFVERCTEFLQEVQDLYVFRNPAALHYPSQVLAVS